MNTIDPLLQDGPIEVPCPHGGESCQHAAFPLTRTLAAGPWREEDIQVEGADVAGALEIAFEQGMLVRLDDGRIAATVYGMWQDDRGMFWLN